MKVFGYGSLISAGSLAATLGRALPAPRPAFLPGYVAELVVGTDTRGLTDRYWTRPDGTVFDGVIASYGLVERPGEYGCPGAVHDIPDSLLPALDARERDYARMPVTLADTAGQRLAAVTYVQHPQAERVLEEACRTERAVVTQEYLDLVAGALAALAPDVLRRAAHPTHLPVVPLVFHEGSPPPVG
ncbi:gamma-glutamylcyclotransferase family protein [Spongisporangium articulatum]|uniref:Gamma-glutamylcyclotransferase family protein n=1 Tax=Spongisporangium articulatum TaxID=3362603 RepID=A0ABW8ATB3_9ACTN